MRKKRAQSWAMVSSSQWQNFIIVAFVLFLVIRAMNRLMRTEEAKTDVAKPVELPADVKLLAEIRDQMTALNKAVSTRAGL